MKTYNYIAESGIYYSEGLADESPLEPGVFLIPAHATAVAPPAVTELEVAVFRDGEWSVEVLPPPPEPEPVPEPEIEPESLVELTPLEKLARSGLTVDELKGLLGLT
jgi:hypothetical protein